MAEVPQAGAVTPAPPAAPKTDAPAEPPKPDAPPAKTYQQGDVDRIVDKVRKNAVRDTELKMRREYESRQQQPEPKKEAPKEDVAPKRENFETHEEFLNAQTEHTARRVAREERANAEKEAQQKTQREAHEKAEQSWHGRIQKTIEKHPDFQTVLEMNEETVALVGSGPMREFITESDIGPEIVFELCKNPAEAKRIAALPRYKQAAEIAKIEDRLTAQPKADPGTEKTGEPDADKADGEKPLPERGENGRFTAPKNEPSKAPPPIKPVGAGAAAASNLPSDKDTPEEWRRKEIARMNRLKKGE